MWNTPSRERLSKIPRLYETEHIPLKDKVIHLHFFIGDCDWYIVEYDGGGIFFGYTILHADHLNAEWGYISFDELQSLSMSFVQVDCELEEHWGFKKVSDVPKIKTFEDD